jgi:hypothetical protein
MTFARAGALIAALVGVLTPTEASADEPPEVPATAPPPSAQPEPQPTKSLVLPLVLGGAGLAGVTAGILLIATAPATPSGCYASTRKCVPLPGEGPGAPTLADREAQAGKAHGQTLGGGITIGVGVLFVGAGMVAYLLERPPTNQPTGAASLFLRGAVVPYADRDGGGLMTSLRF